MVVKPYIALATDKNEAVEPSKSEILSSIKAAIRETEPEAEIILFGSQARGDERLDSDWDLLILIDKPADLATEQAFRHRLFDLELEFGQAFSTFLYRKTDWSGKLAVTPFYENVEREGIRI